MAEKEFLVSNYGAVGDGITNDGYAVARALAAAAADPAQEKALVFECAKTYRITAVPPENRGGCLFDLDGAFGLRIHGKGAKLLLKGTIRVLMATGCRDIGMDGFIIDYSPRPFILSRLIAADKAGGTADFEAEEDIGQKESYFLAPDPYFLFPNRRDGRYHFFIDSIRLLGEKRYRVEIKENSRWRMEMMTQGEEYLLPLHGGSHLVGAACTIMDSDGFRLANLRFYSHPEFGFDIRNNRGNMLFEGISLWPRDGDREQLVSWRDGFHIKDNTEPIVWDNCRIGPLGDDAFNLSCVYLEVVASDGRTVRALPAEKGRTRALLPGDEFVAYDLATGRLIGEGRAAEVPESRDEVVFRSDRELPGLRPGMQVAFYRFANPGFVVKNSYIEGTVRVRSSGSFENCRFNVFWVRVENEYFVEGPIPKDVTFRNCIFTTPYEKDAEIFHVGTMGLNGLADCAYKCRNIRLENCVFEKGVWGAEPGNELIVE